MTAREPAIARRTEHQPSHDELVARAARWLRDSRDCRIVLTEVGVCGVDTGHEIPDAIGWRSPGNSILIECKASRADFRADQQKEPRRKPWRGMGRERWYLTPPGLIQPAEIPQGWGLLWCYPRILRRKVISSSWEFNRFAEQWLLFWQAADAQWRLRRCAWLEGGEIPSCGYARDALENAAQLIEREGHAFELVAQVVAEHPEGMHVKDVAAEVNARGGHHYNSDKSFCTNIPTMAKLGKVPGVKVRKVFGRKPSILVPTEGSE